MPLPLANVFACSFVALFLFRVMPLPVTSRRVFRRLQEPAFLYVCAKKTKSTVVAFAFAAPSLCEGAGLTDGKDGKLGGIPVGGLQ